jgi:ADP-ribosylglycohydrolase
MIRNDNEYYESALGCLLGACVGDAAGGTLEFLGRQPTDEEVARAMTMPGGGFFRLSPGQITDDGELTLCLARTLASSREFSTEKIAREYARWVRSGPFDIGQTTRDSLGCFRDPEWAGLCETDGYAVAMALAAHSRCLQSKANGSLMRATPLGIWGFRLKPNEIALFAKEDSGLSHPNNSCRQAAACYVIAISELIRGHRNRNAAFRAARNWAESNANQEVREWLGDAEANKRVAYHPQSGFIKIAFTHAFRHLLLGSTYVEAIRETLLGGGDTDTNACIVGGIIGAACGAESIPDYMKTPVLNCDTRLGDHARPAPFRTDKIPGLVMSLLAHAPDGWVDKDR